MKDLLDGWGLTAVIFLPLVGAVVMMADPQGRGDAAQGRRAGHQPRGVRDRHRAGRRTSTTTRHHDAAVRRQDKAWIDVINSRYIVGLDGISLPLLALTAVHRPAGDHLLVGPLPRAAQPQGLPDPDPHPRDRDGRHVRRPGPHPLLRLLRGRAAPDVLHDRRLGRRAAPVRLDQVLPLHAVRLGPDDRVVPVALLPGRGRTAATRSTPSTCGALTAWARRRPGPVHRGARLRRHVHGLRHQGADVPVPHLAARRPHPGAHAGLGDPGRRPAEARHLRLRPHRHPDPPRGGRGVGAVDRRCWPSSASSTARSAASPRPT